jgi:ribosomal protein L11 methyltransferase
LLPFAKKDHVKLYISYHFTIEPKELGSEILIAELGKPLLKALLKQKQESLVCAKGFMWDEKILKTYKFCSQENLK